MAHSPAGVGSVLSAVARAVVMVLVAVGATAAGVGWLYLLRHSGSLAAGPRLREALPLQRLAGESSQPLLRLVVAWLPAGLAAGLALRSIGLRRTGRAALVFAACAVLLLATGAIADALTANDTVRTHLAEQAGRVATWLAAGLMALGAAAP